MVARSMTHKPSRTRKARERTTRLPKEAPRSGVGRVWNIMCLTALVIGFLALGLLILDQVTTGVGALLESIGSALGTHDAAAGERMGWWGFPLVLFVMAVGIETVWAVLAWIFWTPDNIHRWEVPDSKLSEQDLAERREYEAETLEMYGEDSVRHPLRRKSTWFTIAAFLLTVAGPAFLEANTMANLPKPTYSDGREGLLQIGKRCPALATEVAAAIAKGPPTSQEVVSMRMRARVIAESPLKGQVCAA
jgi:hypothetical protein